MYDFKKIEKKWQEKWEKSGQFKAKTDFKKKKFYCLEMYPYPSGYGLHMGHLRNYSIGDCIARFKRMQGYNVLYPIGYDSFGLPAENAAIKEKVDPEEFTEKNIKFIKKQQKAMGLSYDWEREVKSHDVNYYKHEQELFLKFLEKGLAYKKKASVSFCPKCNTVLANEQVEDGKCWRCSTEVEVKELEQWFFKITDYAEELLEDLKKLEWPERVKVMQKNWIGKSYGTFVDFKLVDSNKIIKVFTTRPDTLFGVTFIVYAPEHPKVMEYVKETEYEERVKKFVRKVMVEERYTRSAEEQEKEGMFIGKYAINPVNGDKIPIYIANFVLLEYGTGVVMAVPAHDQRDFEFAKKYNIPIKQVIKPKEGKWDMRNAYVDEGLLVNSGEFDGLPNYEAMSEITRYLKKKELGEEAVQYRLKDWLISRQRYWGTPIPIIYCKKCGMVNAKVPVKLPKNVKFTGRGNPLESVKEFVNVKCPKCDGNAKRETDTMDTFVDSSWYFLRYCNPKDEEMFNREDVGYWMPVDQYIGGIEHACMHLLYARFFTKAIRDLGYHNIDEPFTRLLCQGMVTKDGAKMSKSLGNVVDPMEIINKYGADTARIFILSAADPEKELEWDDKGVKACYNFLCGVHELKNKKNCKADKALENKMHKTIRDATKHIEEYNFNLAISCLMDYTRYLNAREKISKESFDVLLELLNPFAPHISSELHKGAIKKWPEFDERKIDEKLDALEKLESDVRSDVEAIKKLVKFKPKKVKIFVAEEWKYELYNKLKELVEKNDGKEIIRKVLVKGKEKETASIVNFVMKDKSRIPKVMFSQREEIETLKKINLGIKTEVLISKGEKQALPGKPAIVFEK